MQCLSLKFHNVRRISFLIIHGEKSQYGFRMPKSDIAVKISQCQYFLLSKDNVNKFAFMVSFRFPQFRLKPFDS